MIKELRRDGFTLIEILIVVVLMAVLAALVIPYIGASTDEARLNTTRFNLSTLRSQLQTYKSEHDGAAPADLEQLTLATNRQGTTETGDGPLDYGPYLWEIPANLLADEGAAHVVKPPAANPPVTAEPDAGWLYDATTGEVWINHADYLHD